MFKVSLVRKGPGSTASELPSQDRQDSVVPLSLALLCVPLCHSLLASLGGFKGPWKREEIATLACLG